VESFKKKKLEQGAVKRMGCPLMETPKKRRTSVDFQTEKKERGRRRDGQISCRPKKVWAGGAGERRDG